MTQVQSYFEAIKLLEDSKVLVYKPEGGKLTYITLVSNERIAIFSESVRYNISFQEFSELLKENKVFIFEKDIETTQEF